jgi:hypothetical protein
VLRRGHFSTGVVGSDTSIQVRSTANIDRKFNASVPVGVLIKSIVRISIVLDARSSYINPIAGSTASDAGG